MTTHTSDQKTILVLVSNERLQNAIIEQLKPVFKVRFMVPNLESKRTTELAALNVELVQGLLKDPKNLKDAMMGVYGVVYQAPKSSVDIEEFIGQKVGEAVKESLVKHFVYVNTDACNTMSCNLHLNTINVKCEVLKFFKALNLPLTTISPVSFMEDMLEIIILRHFQKVCDVIGNFPVQLVALEDVAKSIRIVLENPSYINKQISLAGDMLDRFQITKYYEKVTGEKLQTEMLYAPLRGMQVSTTPVSQGAEDYDLIESFKVCFT
jgi:uncharacterized protein YbjT (DUF2867 family)